MGIKRYKIFFDVSDAEYYSRLKEQGGHENAVNNAIGYFIGNIKKQRLKKENQRLKEEIRKLKK